MIAKDSEDGTVYEWDVQCSISCKWLLRMLDPEAKVRASEIFPEVSEKNCEQVIASEI